MEPLSPSEPPSNVPDLFEDPAQSQIQSSLSQNQSQASQSFTDKGRMSIEELIMSRSQSVAEAPGLGQPRGREFHEMDFVDQRSRSVVMSFSPEHLPERRLRAYSNQIGGISDSRSSDHLRELLPLDESRSMGHSSFHNNLHDMHDNSHDNSGGPSDSLTRQPARKLLPSSQLREFPVPLLENLTGSAQSTDYDDSEALSPSRQWNLRRVLTATGILSTRHHPHTIIPSPDPHTLPGPLSFLEEQYGKLTGIVGEPLFNKNNSPSHNNHPKTLTYLPRQRHFVVLEISHGRCKRHFIQTPELLRIVHTHNRHGVVEDALPGSLKLRDLRQICFQSLGSQRASVELRRNCILFNMLQVRCIILHEKLILILQSSDNSRPFTPLRDVASEYHTLSDSFMEENENNLIKKLVQISELRTNGPFEFAVLESLLVEVCSYLTDELSPVVTDAASLHDFTVGHLSSAHRLHEISDLKRKVDTLSDRLKGVYGALQELLDNDEDLRRIEVTRFWVKPQEWENPPDTSASEDAEILLECYEQEVESMLRQINRIDEGLDDTLQMIQLHLASIRNAFLKSELGLDVVGTVITFIGAIAGIFGMNIPNGFEHNDGVFWPMTHVLLGLCAITAVLTVVVFRRVKL